MSSPSLLQSEHVTQRPSPLPLDSPLEHHRPEVERRIRRVLGPLRGAEIADVVQEVFVQVLGSIDRLRDPAALPAWMATVATRTALRCLRHRRARAWLRFLAPSDLPELGAEDPPPEVSEAYRRTHEVVASMPPAERVVFVLRYVERRDLRQIASCCQVSVATVKRRLKRARERFARAAAADGVLRSWLEEGSRWRD